MKKKKKKTKNTRANRSVTGNCGLGGASFKSGPFLSLMFLDHVNDVERSYKTNYIYWRVGNFANTSMI